MEHRTDAEIDRRMDALLSEAQAFSMGEGGVHAAADEIERRLGEAGIGDAIAGALALDPSVRAKFDEFWLLAQHAEDDY